MPFSCAELQAILFAAPEEKHAQPQLCNIEYLSLTSSLPHLISAPQPNLPALIYQGQAFLRASHAFNTLDPDLETSR